MGTAGSAAGSRGVANGDEHRHDRNLPGAMGNGRSSGPGRDLRKDDAAAIQAVGKHTGDRREHDAREKLQDEDQAEQFRGAGQTVDEQRHRHEGNGLAKLRTELRQPEPSERRDGGRVAKPGRGCFHAAFLANGCRGGRALGYELRCYGGWLPFV